MRAWMLLAVLTCMPIANVAAQPKSIPIPPEFEKLLGPSKFDPVKLRDAIAYPIAGVRLGIGIKRDEKAEDNLPPAVIEKKLVGDERDAEWLLKLGRSLENAKSERAAEVYAKAAAAFRKRIAQEPKNASLYLQLADSLGEQHDGAGESFFAVHKCLELDPKNHRGWSVLGFHYWVQFLRHVYGDKDKIAWEVSSSKPPPSDIRAMTDAEKERARTLLKYIQVCEKERERHAPDDVDNVIQSALMGAHWAAFDSYFRSGKWDLEGAAAARFMSQSVVSGFTKYGREKQDPGAYGLAAMAQFVMFAREAQDPSLTFGNLTPAQQKVLAEYIGVIEKLAASKDHPTATRATFVLAMLSTIKEDPAKTKRYAEKALALAPRERAVVDLMAKFVKGEEEADYEKFWLAHAAQHPSPRVWELLTAFHFRAKRYAEADRYLSQAEKLDPTSRRLQLARAALALKSNPNALTEVGKSLDALETRLEEKEEAKLLIVVEDLPTLADAHQYLRAIHTAFSGKWEQGRDQLLELRDRDVLVEDIHLALESFPRRPIILPVQRLDPPAPAK